MKRLIDSDRPWLWFTLGPATIDLVDEALLVGANGVRYTLSYATPELHVTRAKLVAARAAALGRSVYMIADLPGEKFRLGSFPREKIEVPTGGLVKLATPRNTDIEAPVPVLPLQNESLLTAVGAGTTIVVGDGGVELRVTDADAGDFVTCEVVRGGSIEQNRGLTLVGGRLEPRSLQAGDLDTLYLLAESNVFDAVALSFVSNVADLKTARDAVSTAGRPIALVSKIETLMGVERIGEICEQSDIVMAARGDLALAIDPSLLYAAVARIADSAAKAGVPWIVATQLLEGLDHFGFPTRAELTDVVSWMARGAAGAMLSRETVFGNKPLESIRMLRSLLGAPRVWGR